MSDQHPGRSGDWWDCHFHYFDKARYPLAPNGVYLPEDASLEQYQALCHSRGIKRGVLVHPSVYGADHASFEDALATHGNWLRGVAVVYSDQSVTSDSQIERWDRLGTCGSRINRLFPGSPTDVDTVVRRVKPLGWHIQVLVDIVDEIDLVKKIAAHGVSVVVDHFGHHPVQTLLHSGAFKDVLALMREGSVWVKLSGAYRVQRTEGPWASLQPLVEALMEANDRRLVWGSDWPHPPDVRHPFPRPTTSAISRTIPDWFSEPTLRKRVMAENPALLYGQSLLRI